jgi:Uma2 family endonuclease
MAAVHNPPTHEVVELFPHQGEWTEELFFPLTERNRVIELSNGRLIMLPMPTTEQQDIVGNIYTALRMHVRTHKLGNVGMAPLPVRLWPGNVREPDAMVMLNEHMERVQNQRWGPPDLMAEVLSPGTQSTDRTKKLTKYAAAGMQKYWIVEPEKHMVEVHSQAEDEAYTHTETYNATDTLESRLLEGFTLPIADVFAE